MCFVKHSARICRLGDGITVSACLAMTGLSMTCLAVTYLAGTYLAMTGLSMTYLAGEGTSYKTRSATSAFGGHG